MSKTEKKKMCRYQRIVKIAAVTVRMRSCDPIELIPGKHKWMLDGFLLKSSRRIDIDLVVKCKAAPFDVSSGKRLFYTRNPSADGVDWSLYSVRRRNVIVEYFSSQAQVADMNARFSRGTIYMPGFRFWNEAQIIFHVLQIIILNYLAYHKGMFVHSAAVVDKRGRGFLFAGPGSCGKSTLARLFQKDKSLRVISDDRVIVRKIGRYFYLFGSPWHSSFKQYLRTGLKRGVVRSVFFIRRSDADVIVPVSRQSAFRSLWSNLFLSFWNKDILKRQVAAGYELLPQADFYSFGFRKSFSAVRAIAAFNSKRGKGII